MLGTDLDGPSRRALAAAPGAGGLVLLPYLDGERTPNRPDATGVLRGLTTQNATAANLARAAIEAVLATLAEAADLIAAQGASRERVLLIGGGARSEAARRLAPGDLRGARPGAGAGGVRRAGRGPPGRVGARGYARAARLAAALAAGVHRARRARGPEKARLAPGSYRRVGMRRTGNGDHRARERSRLVTADAYVPVSEDKFSFGMDGGLAGGGRVRLRRGRRWPRTGRCASSPSWVRTG